MTQTIKVIVAGGRKFCSEAIEGSKSRKMLPVDHPQVIRAMNHLDSLLYSTPREETIEIVCGLAMGADELGRMWQETKTDVEISLWKPEWDLYKKPGKKNPAGIIRNEQMGDHADKAIVFWDGVSPGSKHMMGYMKKLGKECIVVRYDEKLFP